jgi:hypothetical protein
MGVNVDVFNLSVFNNLKRLITLDEYFLFRRNISSLMLLNVNEKHQLLNP